MTSGRLPILPIKKQTVVRLIPAAILEPKLRLADGNDIIEHDYPLDHAYPGLMRTANPGVRDKALYSFEASRWRNNRFNKIDGHGAYYAADTLSTAIAEIRWHLTHDQGLPFERTQVYRAVIANVSGQYLDLREATGLGALDADPERAYPAGAGIAKRALEKHADGIIYPSARSQDGTCYAVLTTTGIDEIRLGQLVSFEKEGRGGEEWAPRIHLPQHAIGAEPSISRV